MTRYATFRDFNFNNIKTAKDFEYLARSIFHKKLNTINLLFKLANKNRNIKKSWIAKNCIEIYKYHRLYKYRKGV